MKDIKTTITAFVTGTTGLLAYFNILIPESYSMPIILVGTVLLGWFTKDKGEDKK